jgi:hypothetical protein
MLTILWGITGQFVFDWLSENAMFNSLYFCDTIITMLVRSLFSQGPLTARYHWMIHIDNACPHSSKSSTAFLVGQELTRFTHQPYSLDIVPCDFNLFGNINTRLRECYETTSEELQSNATEILASIPGGKSFGAFCE